MQSKSEDGIKWVEFEQLSGKKLKHGLFTRHGGISPAPWASLNTGGTVGDIPGNPRENQKKMLSVFGLHEENVYDVWQVHSSDYVKASIPRPRDAEHQRADIIVTNQPGLILVMRFADCVPILVYDPIKHVCGIAHAGWIGTSKDTAGALVKALKAEFSCKPEDILACIGPSICQNHYQVGKDVVDAMNAIMPESVDEIITIKESHPHLDLWKANQLQLMRQGVRQIEIASLCTVCNNEDWFSHRGEHGKTGRFGALICMD